MVTALKISTVQLKLVRASIFTCQKVNYLKIVVHILFAVKGVLLNDLEPMTVFTIQYVL